MFLKREKVKMKVVVKNPNEAMKVIEVADLKEINKIIGNVDKNGEVTATDALLALQCSVSKIELGYI